MAYLNERIGADDCEKYDLERVCGERNLPPHAGQLYRRDWMIDRERDTFLIQTSSHPNSAFAGWAFYWRGHWMFFELMVIDAHVNLAERSCWSHYWVRGFAAPPSLELAEIADDLRAALSAYAGCGVFSDGAKRWALVDFIA